MTAIWFGLAVLCLAGAGALLYVDRLRRQRSGRTRQVWAKNHGYTYKMTDPALPSTWRRATFAKQGYLSAVDIATGSRRGVRFTLFDLEDAATIIAVQRRMGSDVDIDLRLKTAPPPRDADLELLGAMGDRVVFASDIEIARRVTDQRMASLAEILPVNLQILWSENAWTLGSLPVSATPRDWDQAIDGVIRFSGLLHVLPPVDERGSRGVDERGPRSGDERGPRSAEQRGVPRAGEQRGTPRFNDEKRSGDERSGPRPVPRPQQASNPQPVPRRDEDADLADQPGGPFHPGFRPYQGPSPRP